jgi:hypothetical protein
LNAENNPRKIDGTGPSTCWELENKNIRHLESSSSLIKFTIWLEKPSFDWRTKFLLEYSENENERFTRTYCYI